MGESFFDFQERIARRNPAPRADAASPSGAAPLTVTQLTSKIERVIKSGLPEKVVVRGEVSNYKLHGGSGHCYFSLKDAGACIPCVMWKSDAVRLKFAPKDGMELLASGRVSVFVQQGKYQFYVTRLDPLGQGALELAFQQLKAKLEAEGLFAAERKRPLPLYPARLALVTSRETAALQDMLKVLRRYPWLKLSCYHVPVQGTGAGERIAAAIAHLNSQGNFIDIILLGRGGGSLEDLWAFNEEVVARAIAASVIPIVTGIGHEVDTSIADLVADHHAHTPTEAAQTVVQAWKTVSEALEVAGVRLRRGLRAGLANARQRLAAVTRHELFRRPLDRVNQLRQLLDDRQRAMSLGIGERLREAQRRVGESSERLERNRPQITVARLRQKVSDIEKVMAQSARRRVRALDDRLQGVVVSLRECHPRHQTRLAAEKLAAMENRLRLAGAADRRGREDRLHGLERQLQALNPKRVLHRGYSLTTLKKSGAVVRDAGQVKPGDRVITRFANGKVESVVEDSVQLPLFE